MREEIWPRHRLSNTIHFRSSGVLCIRVVMVHFCNEITNVFHEVTLCHADFIAFLSIEDIFFGTLFIVLHKRFLYAIMDGINGHILVSRTEFLVHFLCDFCSELFIELSVDTHRRFQYSIVYFLRLELLYSSVVFDYYHLHITHFLLLNIALILSL